MHKTWYEVAWNDYMAFQEQDRKTVKRIHALLKSIDRNGYAGIGKVEPLRGEWSGWWSARINAKDRLIFRIENGVLEIAACHGHYE